MASRIAAFAALGLTAAALAGCMHDKPVQTTYRWSYMAPADAEAPRLAYGLPNSDDLVLMMSCRSGADLDVTAVGVSGREIALASDGAESRLPASRVEDELNEGGTLQARAPAGDAALAGFRKSGDLTLLVGGERHSLAAGSADRGQVREFFRACGA